MPKNWEFASFNQRESNSKNEAIIKTKRVMRSLRASNLALHLLVKALIILDGDDNAATQILFCCHQDFNAKALFVENKMHIELLQC